MNSKPLILFVIKGSALNRKMNTGIENLAWGLAARDYDVHILSGGNKPESHDYILPHTVTYHFTGNLGRPQSFISAFLRLKEYLQIDSVIGWLKNIGPLTHLYARREHKMRPAFIANQGAMTGSLESGHMLKRFMQRVVQNARRIARRELELFDAWHALLDPCSYYHKIDHVVSITAAVKDNVMQVYNFPSDTCSIIHRGVDTQIFSPPAVRSKSGRYLRLLYTGNVIETKGLSEVIKAITTLSTQIYLALCGNGSEAYVDELRCRLDSSELTKKHELAWYGPLNREELILQYQKADIFVFCSYAEGLGKSLIEAMSCGLPVIVSDIAPFKEIVEDHVNGLMVPVRSPESIAEAINEYGENPRLREQCGRNARETVLKRFIKQNEIDGWVSILNEYIVSNK